MEYRTAWISSFDVDGEIKKNELDGWVFLCFTPQHRVSGEGLKGTFLREYQILMGRKHESSLE